MNYDDKAIRTKLDKIGTIAQSKYVVFRPILLLKNEKIIVDILNELLGIRQNIEISGEYSDKEQKILLQNLRRYIEYVNVKHKVNSHKFLIFSATLSITISLVSLIIAIISKS